MDDIVEIKAKKKRLEDDIETLTTSAEEYVDQAESKGKVTLITKSNALRRSAKEKKETMGTIEKELEEKRNNYGTLSELIINVAAVDLF
jgi:hypothetical protein